MDKANANGGASHADAALPQQRTQARSISDRSPDLGRARPSRRTSRRSGHNHTGRSERRTRAIPRIPRTPLRRRPGTPGGQCPHRQPSGRTTSIQRPGVGQGSCQPAGLPHHSFHRQLRDGLVPTRPPPPVRPHGRHRGGRTSRDHRRSRERTAGRHGAAVNMTATFPASNADQDPKHAEPQPPPATCAP